MYVSRFNSSSVSLGFQDVEKESHLYREINVARNDEQAAFKILLLCMQPDIRLLFKITCSSACIKQALKG